MSEQEGSLPTLSNSHRIPPMPAVKPAREEQSDTLLLLLLEEQRQTNQLLVMLIEAMAEAEDEGDEEAEPTTYLDGSPV